MYTIQFDSPYYTPFNTSERMCHTKEEAEKKIASLRAEEQKKCRILHYDPFNLFGIQEVK